jgi:hypothetical protein
MKIKIILLMMFILSVTSFSAIAAENMVAKVVILRGNVKAKLLNGSMIDVKADQDIPEGAVIQTAEKSFVKLIFIDKSQMNLGPSSQMVINAFPKKEAGIITLVKGQIRSQVTKDYMDIEDKNKSKLFIKTNTAAMGIRGTDFQVNYNPENQNTSLITFEGKVAMSHIEKSIREDAFDQSKLEKVVSSDKAVMVSGGHISAVNLNVAERAMVPTILAPTQIEALKSNENGLKEGAKEMNESSKQIRNPIPPGVEGTTFSNNSGEVEKIISKNMGSEETLKVNKEIEKTQATKSTDSTGFFNDKTGEYKMPAGSIIDLKTVNIIPPPTNAVFDPNTKTFIVPENFGRIDKASGEYKAPEGLKLNSDGKFQIDTEALKTKPITPANNAPVNPEANNTNAKADGTMDPNGRMPASTTTMLAPPPMPGSIMDIRPDMLQFAIKNSPTFTDRPPVMNPTLQAIAQDKITTTETVNQNNSNLNNTATTTRAKINIGAE